MANIRFYKMVASGNDFIVIDHRRSNIRNLKAFTRKACDRHFGVGADGVLLLEKSKKANLKMRIINADGSEAEMCGNGARAAALFSHRIIGLGKKFVLETRAGLIHCEVKTWTVKVQLTDPVDYRSLAHLSVLKRQVPYYFVNTGVPHAVIFEDHLDEVPVKELGSAIRYHERFAPKGTNVNFVELSGPRSIRIRTYERGVEDETLACGTGSTAAAVIAVLEGFVRLPVEVRTKSGETLKIDFQQEGFSVTNVSLEGMARLIFEGSIDSDF